MKSSPALSILKKAPKTLAGRTVGVLVADGNGAALIDRLRTAVEKEGAHLEVVAPKIGGARSNGKRLPADHALAPGPSILFDAVVVAATGGGADRLAEHPTAIDWLRDAFAHLKVIGHVQVRSPSFSGQGSNLAKALYS